MRSIFVSALAAATRATAPFFCVDLDSAAFFEATTRGCFVVGADLVAFVAGAARREAVGLRTAADFADRAGFFAVRFAVDGLVVALAALVFDGFLALATFAVLAFAVFATAAFVVFAAVAFRVFVAVAFFTAVAFLVADAGVFDGLAAEAAFERVAGRAGFDRAAAGAGALDFRVGLALRAALAGVRAFEPLVFFTVPAVRAFDRVALVAFGFLASPRFGM